MEELIASVPVAIDTIVAALVGGAIGMLVQFHLNRRSEIRTRDETEKRLADAFRGEMKGVRDQLKVFRQLARSLELLICRGHDVDVQPILMQLRITCDVTTPIYDADAPNIGRLWRKMARKVAEFYADVHSLGTLGKVISEGATSQWLPLLKWYVWECNRLVWEAQDIADMLDELSKTGKYPKEGDEQRRTKAPQHFAEVDLTGLVRGSQDRDSER